MVLDDVVVTRLGNKTPAFYDTATIFTLYKVFIFPSNTSIITIKSAFKGNMFKPYRAIIMPYYKNRFVYFQYILGSQIVYIGGMM
jgi:hypothetical protein